MTDPREARTTPSPVGVTLPGTLPAALDEVVRDTWRQGWALLAVNETHAGEASALLRERHPELFDPTGSVGPTSSPTPTTTEDDR